MWLLAYLVDWHRREINAEWWEYFRLRDLPEEDLFDERKAVAGLTHVQRVGPFLGKNGKPTGSVIDRYAYPPQDIEIDEGDKLKLQIDQPFGEVMAHDRAGRTLDVKKSKAAADIHPTAAFAFDAFPTDTQQEAVIRMAERLLAPQEGMPSECGLELLFGHSPRLATQPFARQAAESEQDFAIRIVTDLDRTTLAIQGPPGAGKTYIGAQMILALVRAGKKVGVTAHSHKVIHNLLEGVLKQARPGDQARVAAKGGEGDEGGAIRIIKDNDAALEDVGSGEVNVLGGTSWLWSRAEFAGAVDVLFVDEAGQVSLANALAVSHAANSMVLLGDPRQLAQPSKGSHPDGVGVSALQHVLGGKETMPAERGIFLPITWRMSPTLTAFTSELLYEGKLTAKPGLEKQALAGVDDLAGSRFWMVPVVHDGCRSSSDAEVEVVAALVERLLSPGSQWVDEHSVAKPLTAADIRVVAPFNAQVNRLAQRLGPDVPVGTVDKFQGQTCAVVIYSMATSR
ncbi:MAG: AAA domain-containing protein, partial [Rubrivivax sp.]|nr:AAA domain-containing protein [Rubrivivax sp.]